MIENSMAIKKVETSNKLKKFEKRIKLSPALRTKKGIEEAMSKSSAKNKDVLSRQSAVDIQAQKIMSRNISAAEFQEIIDSGNKDLINKIIKKAGESINLEDKFVIMLLGAKGDMPVLVEAVQRIVNAAAKKDELGVLELMTLGAVAKKLVDEAKNKK